MTSRLTSRKASRIGSTEAYVWIWLARETEPVVAGLLTQVGKELRFNYGKSYLARKDAISIYGPELPLRAGDVPLLEGLRMPGCIRDGVPDAWGRRVLISRKLGLHGRDAAGAELDELAYLLESGSDRIGALDFQDSAKNYIPRVSDQATLEELMESAERADKGIALRPEVDAALQYGSSVGGARPKALVSAEDKKLIAKFSTGTDLYNVIKAEYLAMRLASLASLDVATVRLTKALGKDVLLVERFDRERTAQGWLRKPVVSALTMLGLDERMAKYSSYEDLAELVRNRFTNPAATLRELYGRIVFNILCGNTDDHARNHAAFWDGERLTLTPAYDVCPQPRVGNEASQAMLIDGDNRMSQLRVCLEAAPKFFLDMERAKAIMERQVRVIRENWSRVCDEAQLTEVERQFFWRRQFLHPSVFFGAPADIGGE